MSTSIKEQPVESILDPSQAEAASQSRFVNYGGMKATCDSPLRSNPEKTVCRTCAVRSRQSGRPVYQVNARFQNDRNRSCAVVWNYDRRARREAGGCGRLYSAEYKTPWP